MSERLGAVGVVIKKVNSESLAVVAIQATAKMNYHEQRAYQRRQR